jgi:hypothetical protein
MQAVLPVLFDLTQFGARPFLHIYAHMGEWTYSSTILDLGVDGGELSASHTGHFTPEEEILISTHWTDPRACLEALGIEKRKPFTSARN